MVIEFDTSVRIARSRERVFAVLADFESYLARWAKGPIAAVRTSGDGGAGSRYTVTARVGPFKVRSPYEVKSHEAPSIFAGAGIAGPVRFEEEYRLVEEAEETVLTQSIHATPRGPIRLIEPAVGRQLRKLMAADLERLKALLEAESPV